jgi:hypothetical protein
MRRPWDAPIARLRRRALASAALGALGRGLFPAAPAALVFVVATRLSPWARFFAPELLAAGVAFLGLMAFVAALRARRSTLYFAKWIDVESKLEDRLASSVEWDGLATRDEFQQRCIDQLAVEVAARKRPLVLPATRPRGLGQMGVALLFVVVAAAVSLHEPTPELEPDATQKVKLPEKVAVAAKETAQKLTAEVTPLEDIQLAQMASDLSVLVQRLDAGALDRERSLAELERLRQKASRVAEPRTSLASSAGGGSVGALARALASGDADAAKSAIDQVTSQLNAGTIPEAEVGQLKSLLGALAQLAETANAPDSASLLREASSRLAENDLPGAGKRLAAAKTALPALARPLAVSAAAERMAEVAQALERSLGPGLAEGEVVTALKTPRTGAAAAPSLIAGQTSLTGTNGAGERSTAEHVNSAPPKPAAGDRQLQLAGVWNGRVLRDLFTDTGAAPSDEARRLLVEHERVAEERFLRDEIPGQYADAVRAYFAGLHERGGTWTPTRK